MSTILRALRRLEQEKTRRVERPLREEVASGSDPGRRFPIVLVGIALFAVGTGMGAGALLLWPQRLAETGAPLAAAAPDVAAAAGPLRTSPAPRGAPPATAQGQGRADEAKPASEPAGSAAPPPAAAPEAGSAASPPAAAPETGSAAPPPAAAPEAGSAAPPPAAAPPGSSASAPASSRTESKARSEAAGIAEASRPSPEAADEPALSKEALASEVEVVRRIAPPSLEIRDEPDEPRPPRPGEVRPGAEALKARPRSAPHPSLAGASAAPRSAPQPSPPGAGNAPRGEAPPVSTPQTEARPEPGHSPVPVILVSRTHWHPRPERREAQIEVETDGTTEQRSVREGDSVGPLVVETIEPTGVVFRYDDVQLRHAVGAADGS